MYVRQIIVRLYRLVRGGAQPLRCLIVRAYMVLLGVHLGGQLRCWSLPLIRIHETATIRLGSGVCIRNTLAENPAGIAHRTVLVAAGPDARLVIGDDVGMSGAVLYCTREIVIEDRVQLGVGAKVYDTDFHALDPEDRRLNKPAPAAAVRICADVWVGAEATILKGVTVGARSVIAAHAVVTRDIPPDVLAAGIPARVVRTLRRVQTAVEIE